MIPLVDAYLKDLIQRKMAFIKANPQLISKIFGTLGTRTTLKSFTEFVTKRKVGVLIGFPREAQNLPCYVITVAGEQETPLGLGDNIDDYEAEDYSNYEGDPDLSMYVLDSVDMKSTYRIECWSDNGDLTAYMYILLKWCLLSGRREMLAKGLKLPQLTGTDLEPVPDYIPVFVYRRSLMITFQYENVFFDDEYKRGDEAGHIPLEATPENLQVHFNGIGTSAEPEDEEPYI